MGEGGAKIKRKPRKKPRLSVVANKGAVSVVGRLARTAQWRVTGLALDLLSL